MNTKVKNIITLFGVLAVLAGGAGFGTLSLQANAAEGELITGANATLALPASYEEYLALNAPSGVALSEKYIAIADGNALYIYDREAGRYEKTSLDEGRTISTIGFAGERLFVADTGGSNYFYEYNFALGEVRRIGINCSTFCIDGDVLYTATVSAGATTIVRYKISDLQAENPAYELLGSIENRNTPSLAVLGGVLYCTFDAQVFYPDAVTGQFRPDWLASNPSMATNVQQVAAFEGSLWYTAEGGLYRTEPGTWNSELALAGSGLTGLTAYDGALYAVQKSSVKRIDVTEDGAVFSEYEIAAASSSPHRLAHAVDSVRAGELLVTADAGNQRVSVSTIADMGTGNVVTSTYTIPCVAADGMPYTPSLVATDGSMIAVASSNYIYLYERGETEFYYRHLADTTNVRGLACVYGTCYYITEYGYGVAKEGFTAFPRSGNAPKALCADVYGTLYVVGLTGGVQAYTESAFANPEITKGGVVDIDLPAEFTSLRADFEGNLYCLSGNSLYKNGQAIYSFAELPENLQFVYGGEKMPVSFALGFEDDEVFFLFGNYIVRSNPDVVDIPTLSEIDASGVYEKVFTPHTEEGLLIDIPAGTIGIRTDLDVLRAENPAYFPYRSYYRTAEDMRGILLATKDRYALVILYEVTETSRTFTANLFRMSDETAVPTEEYWEGEQSEMYLSSEVSAYFFPALHDALAGERLARGTHVRVLGYAEAPERTYALVEWGEPNTARMDKGSASYGFVPVSYLTDIAPVPEEDAAYEPAYLKATKAGVLFTAEDGDTVTVYERIRAEFTRNEDGTYTAKIVGDGIVGRAGKVYTATVSGDLIDRGESDALRISLMVILSVLAVGIIGGYVYLLPRKDRE